MAGYAAAVALAKSRTQLLARNIRFNFAYRLAAH